MADRALISRSPSTTRVSNPSPPTLIHSESEDFDRDLKIPSSESPYVCTSSTRGSTSRTRRRVLPSITSVPYVTIFRLDRSYRLYASLNKKRLRNVGDVGSSSTRHFSIASQTASGRRSWTVTTQPAFDSV